jgi:predicted  nucleic acid-binding Zn-ribbon protein
MNDILQNLVILQDLDEMISESNNTEIITQQEEMGFEINGLEKLIEAREELIKKIPPEVFNHYNRVRARYSRAIAPVRENICLGCFIKIPTQISSREMGNQVLRNCENCGRYLYWV